MIEPSLEDIAIADGTIYVWEGNPLCEGDVYNEESCTKVGTAYGVCTLLSLNSDECDSVDTWEILDQTNGAILGTLISRGFTGLAGGGTVVGGTGCFENAGGTVLSEYVEDEVTGLEMWVYDLSNVQLA